MRSEETKLHNTIKALATGTGKAMEKAKKVGVWPKFEPDISRNETRSLSQLAGKLIPGTIKAR